MYLKYKAKISAEIAAIEPDFDFEYLTSKTNKSFSLNATLSIRYKGKGKGLSTKKSEKSSTVAGTRVELVTSGL